MQDITTYDGQSPFDQIKHVRADDIEGAAEAAYVAASDGNIGHTAGAHVPWDEVDPYYRHQYRRIARAVIDHVIPSLDLFSQEES